MIEQSMDVAFVIAHKLREGKERVFPGVQYNEVAQMEVA
jgi:hypothetical protein